MRQWFLLVVVALIGGLVAVWGLSARSRIEISDYEPPRPPHQYAVTKVVPDEGHAFRIDPAVPFRILFGRGGEGKLVNTLQITECGRVVLYRWKQELVGEVIEGSWYVAECRLTAEQLATVLEAVAAHDLTALAKMYNAENIGCGTQWILWIQQGDREKSVYCSNYFPGSLVAFANRLDEILVAVGRKLKWRSVAWHRVPERELWASSLAR